jgi:hypothetical protein
VWSVPTTGDYLISAFITRRTDLPSDSAEIPSRDDQQAPRVVLRFEDGAVDVAARELGAPTCVSAVDRRKGETLEWTFPVQPCVEDEEQSGSARGQHRAWMERAVADKRNGSTVALAIDAQHKRRVAGMRGRVEAEEDRRKRYGRQHFHFPR